MGCANKANIEFQTWHYSKYKDKIIFSEKLGSNKTIKGDVIFANLIFSCKNLKFKEVSFQSEILNYDPYLKDILDKNFHEFFNE